jgi:integrase/recombinase XerD
MPAVGPRSSLKAATGAFDDHLVRAGKTDNTRRAFASDLRLLSSYLGSERAVVTITTDDLHRFLAWMQAYSGRPCSEKTYARRVTTLKVFCAWLTDEGALPRDPAAPLVHRQAAAPLPRVLTDDEVTRLLEASRLRRRGEAADPRPELLVRLLLDTGIKKGELARLDVTDLDTESRPPELLVRYGSHRWRHKERRLSFDAGLLPIVDAYRARFAPTGRLFDCTARNLEYVLADLVKECGLPKGTGFETLRWTSALRHHRAGMPDDEFERGSGCRQSAGSRRAAS